jgi:hypothetical protein
VLHPLSSKMYEGTPKPERPSSLKLLPLVNVSAVSGKSHSREVRPSRMQYSSLLQYRADVRQCITVITQSYCT